VVNPSNGVNPASNVSTKSRLESAQLFGLFSARVSGVTKAWDSSTAVLLEHLTQHIPAQTNAINQFLNNPDSFTTSWPSSDLWNALRVSVWKKGRASFEVWEPVERDHNPVEDSQILPDIVPPTRLVANIPGILLDSLGLGDRDRRILVRSEYEEAEEGVLLTALDRMSPFVVTGQPGIGPSSIRFSLRRGV